MLSHWLPLLACFSFDTFFFPSPPPPPQQVHSFRLSKDEPVKQKKNPLHTEQEELRAFGIQQNKSPLVFPEQKEYTYSKQGDCAPTALCLVPESQSLPLLPSRHTIPCMLGLLSIYSWEMSRAAALMTYHRYMLLRLMRAQQSTLLCDTGMVVTSPSASAHPVQGAWKYKLFMEQTTNSLL